MALVNSVNPFRLQGQKTAAFEIWDALGRCPDYHITPVGNAGNITSHWMGYAEYHSAGVTSKRPVMFGFQAAGAAPIVRGGPVREPSTIATAIRIGNLLPGSSRPKRWPNPKERSWTSPDREILAAYRRVAAEGLFAELASSASVAGLLKLSTEGRLDPGSNVVCVLTGHGLKEPDWAISGAGPTPLVPADTDVVAAELRL